MTATRQIETLTGCLLGTAAGDAAGLCCEGLSPQRQRRLFPHLDGPALLGRAGMVSDDTEHACLTAQAMIRSGEDIEAFPDALARELRRWLLTVPPGLGLATLKASARLLAGVGPENSGVPSAGNGPAMRAPVIGAACGRDLPALQAFVRISTRVTHTDPRAESGALAVALAASMAAVSGGRVSPGDYCAALDDLFLPEETGIRRLIDLAAASAAREEPSAVFAASLGLERGVTGFIYHTVPVVLQSWFRRQDDFRGAILEVVRCGGDTDTTAAILGGILGAGLGKPGIPEDWLARIREWPRSVKWMEEVAARLAQVRSTGASRSPVPLPLWGTAARNAWVTPVILAHGFRRLLPPY